MGLSVLAQLYGSSEPATLATSSSIFFPGLQLLLLHLFFF
jgi:hypothetical protein